MLDTVQLQTFSQISETLRGIFIMSMEVLDT